MNFIKGAIIGMVAGTCLGAMKNEMFSDIMKKGKKEIRKMKRMLSM